MSMSAARQRSTGGLAVSAGVQPLEALRSFFATRW